MKTAATTVQAPTPVFDSFLWPDHVIGKRESRTIREEHNALVNAHAALLAENAALRAALESAGIRFNSLALDAHAGKNTIRAIASRGAQDIRVVLNR